jgi:predicted nucleic acid-binding Zn ribbon protein
MIKECVVCGKKFDAKGRSKTCRDECSEKNERIRDFGRYRKRKPIAIMNCEVCGKDFERIGNRKTCDEKCSKILENMHQNERHRRKRDIDQEYRLQRNSREANRKRDKRLTDNISKIFLGAMLLNSNKENA